MYNTINPINISYRNLPKIAPRKEAQGNENQENVSSESKSRGLENYETYYQNKEFPNGNKVAIDYTQNKINISQILTDFRSTTSTIATPPSIMEEIEQYLGLVDLESQKEKPNKEIILSNLKNASKIADGYISDTLKKESKVVENWVDALFLQKIVLKADPNDVNEAYKLQIEKSEKIEHAKEEGLKVKAEREEAKITFGEKFKGAKSKINNNPKEALKEFGEVLDIAKTTQNDNYVAAVHLERGKILDKYNYSTLAIKEFEDATKCDDGNIKTHAHLGLARIYDDFGEFEGAKENYHQAVATSGEVDNMTGQTLALKGLGTLYADKFDYKNMEIFNNLTLGALEGVENKKIVAKTYQRIADDYSYLGSEQKALAFLKNSTSVYSSINKDSAQNSELAKNYEEAAKLMSSLGNEKKAKSLLLKARLYQIS